MTLQIHSNNLCFPVRTGCLVSNYDDRNGSWENSKLLEFREIPSACDVECCAFSPCGKYMAICFSKYLAVYATTNWNFLNCTTTERKGVSIRFFPKSSLILLAEKSGSVKFFKFFENKIEKIDVILGHNSMLFEALVTNDENFIITCDKDQKIRVTNYPNVYNIQSYCLGHTQFVCSINILQSDGNILISSSGDRTIRLWEITTGKELFKFSNSATVNEADAGNAGFYIKVTSLVIDKNQSLIAAIKFNFNYVTLLKVTGDIKTNINVELFSTIKVSASPYDIEFWQENLICLLEDEKNPVKVHNSKDNFAESKKNFTNLKSLLIENWRFIHLCCIRRENMFSSLFQYKKDADTQYDVKSKKVKQE